LRVILVLWLLALLSVRESGVVVQVYELGVVAFDKRVYSVYTSVYVCVYICACLSAINPMALQVINCGTLVLGAVLLTNCSRVGGWVGVVVCR